MPILPDDPLVKVTLNIYEADAEELRTRYGHGWSTVVRRLVHEHLSRSRTSRTLTVGDIADELAGPK